MQTEETKPLVTDEEHDQGWKLTEVTLRSEKRVPVKLYAPPRRAAREALAKMLESKEVDPVVLACLPDAWAAEDKDRFLDKLTPVSLTQLEYLCFAMAFGNDFQKKMEETSRMLAEKQRELLATATAAQPNLFACAPDSAPEKSEPGAIQS